jgi:DNA-binding transcriptional MerR regulator
MSHGWDNWLFDKRVSITGCFGSHSQAEIIALLKDHGAHIDPRPTRRTKLLLVGEESLPLVGSARTTDSLIAAHRLQLTGYSIEVVGEQMLWQRFGLPTSHPDIQTLYSIPQLGELLNVKRDQLRNWLREGVLQPVNVGEPLPLFDIAQVQLAKIVCHLRVSGLSVSRIGWQLGRLRAWFPNLTDQLVCVSHRGREILVRLDCGRLIEPSGQKWFDFEIADDEISIPYRDRRSVDHWFDEGLRLEDACMYQEAAEAYRSALQLEPNDPVLHFNLGNVYTALDDPDNAIRHFVIAIQIDPEYEDAWTNLESVRGTKHSDCDSPHLARSGRQFVR